MALTQSDLSQFTGSEEFYRYSPLFKGILLTEGAKYLADKAGAYWLMDIICSVQMESKVKREEFQVWELKVTGTKAVATCEDGNGNQVYRQKIGYTDFPLPEIKLYLSNNVIMLPAEY